MDGWFGPNSYPSIAKFKSSSIIPGISAGQLVFHPSANNIMPCLRFTAPSSGFYQYFVKWFAGDSNGNTGETDGFVFISDVLSAYLPATSYSPGLAQEFYFQAGATVDVCVGFQLDQYWSDSTPVSFTVSLLR